MTPTPPTTFADLTDAQLIELHQLAHNGRGGGASMVERYPATSFCTVTADNKITWLESDGTVTAFCVVGDAYNYNAITSNKQIVDRCRAWGLGY